MLTEEGLVPIEEIEVGDKVWSRDDQTGEEAWQQVTRIFQSESQSLQLLSFSNAYGNHYTIQATAGHPFWVKQLGWVESQHLTEGQKVWTRDGWFEVKKNVERQKVAPVFNFEVTYFHTYFISSIGFWVHNSCDDIHRIGGSNVDNLSLKDAEKKLDPPGISVLKSDSHKEAAEQMRTAFPKATKLHEASKTVGSSNVEKIQDAGFSVKPDPTKNFPNHHRITHPEGVEGFSNENLEKRSNAFKDSKGTSRDK